MTSDVTRGSIRRGPRLAENAFRSTRSTSPARIPRLQRCYLEPLASRPCRCRGHLTTRMSRDHANTFWWGLAVIALGAPLPVAAIEASPAPAAPPVTRLSGRRASCRQGAPARAGPVRMSRSRSEAAVIDVEEEMRKMLVRITPSGECYGCHAAGRRRSVPIIPRKVGVW